MARQRLPDEVKRAQGTFQPVRSNPDRPEVAPGIPGMPAQVAEDIPAREEWDRITKLLAPIGYVTELDRPALASYCLAHSKWLRYLDLERKARDHKKMASFSRLAIQWEVVKTRLAGQLGFSPSSRQGIKAPKANKGDGIREFLKGGKAS